MKAILNYGAGMLRVVSVPVPEPKEGRVLLRILACGICGGEHSLVNSAPGATPAAEGVVPGHEYVGEIVETTSPALARGIRVAVSPNNARCGVCANCRRGYHVCSNWPRRTADIGGGYAEYALVEPRQCYPLPEGLGAIEAAMTEPLACVIHAMHRVSLRPGENVIIIGAGANAHLFVQVARQQGAALVEVIDNIQARMDLALEMGADLAVDSAQVDPLHAAPGLSGGADLVIINRGNPSATAQAVKWCTYGGRVLVYGASPEGSAVAIEPRVLLFKEISIIGSRSFSDTFKPALDLIAAGRITVKPLITTVSLTGVIDALRNPVRNIKTVIVP